MYHILVVEDDRAILDGVGIYLKNQGYKVFKAQNGKEGLEILAREEIHLAIVDIMMPVMDGITAMAKIREKCNVPIIMLTAKSEDADKILGLNVGADDYITKPFNPLEVSARVRSQLRRYLKLGAGTPQSDTFVIGGIEMRDEAKEVYVDGVLTALTPTEYDILKLLMSHPDRVYSSKEIYTQVWKEKPIGSDNTVAVHIRHLREKIEIDPADPRYIKVIFGKGYKMEKGRRA